MWHPDALDTFDDHLGTLSHFFNGTNQMSREGEDLWYTTITISHWRLQSLFESEVSKIADKAEKIDKENREKELQIQQKEADEQKAREATDDNDPLGPPPLVTITDFPPKTVSDQRMRRPRKGGDKDPLSTIRQLSMSLVITGDTMGRYWTCCMVSDLLDEPAVAKYVEEINGILQMFIHQQYTGRTLVFMLLLGYFCESLSRECENFMGELDKIMGMDVSLLNFHARDAGSTRD
jgi:hypothetical protein